MWAATIAAANSIDELTAGTSTVQLTRPILRRGTGQEVPGVRTPLP